MSAPPGSYGQPGPYGAPPMGWPGQGTPPPAPKRSGNTVAIVVGVTVPIVLIILAVVGVLVLPRVLNNQQASPSTTPSPSEDPLALPAVGACYDSAIAASPFNARAERGDRVACDEVHTIETIAVGELADAIVPPDEYSAEAHRLYRECEQAAQEYFGLPWRSTYAWLVLSVPSVSAWADGAHWYRCDVAVNDAFYQTSPSRTTGSLRDTVKPITCLSWFATESGLRDIEPSECTVEHQGELAGVFLVPEGADYSDIDALTDEFDETCEPLVLDFLGTSRLPADLTYWYAWPSEDDLDQWVLCMVAAGEDNRGLTDSLRGVGTGPIPFA